MKHAVIAMAVMVVAGCSTHPILENTDSPVSTITPAQQYQSNLIKYQELVDPDCAGLAKYARSIALMKNLGVDFSEIDFILPNTPMGFPKEAIQRDIYTRFVASPPEVSTQTYLKCVQDTYPTTVINYKTKQVEYEMQAREEAFAVIKTRGGGMNLKLSTVLSKWKKR